MRTLRVRKRGDVTMGVTTKLIALGKIPANDSVVLRITGNGLKTLDPVNGHVGKSREIKPSPLAEVKAAIKWLEKHGVSVEPVEINVIES